MLDCPHCRQPALTPWRKLFVGPAGVLPCVACGQPVSMPWQGAWVLLPLFLGIGAALALWSTSWPTALLSFVAGFVLSSALHVFAVPLQARG